MKKLKPEYLLALTSALVALLAFWFEVASLNLPFSPVISALVLSLFLGVITFLVLYFGIKIFLQNRLNHLFKNLQNPPIIKAQRLNEIIDEEVNGWVVENGDIEAMASKIEDIFSKPPLDKKRIIDVTVQKYGIEKIIKQYEALFLDQ